jgi:hypothetical protein
MVLGEVDLCAVDKHPLVSVFGSTRLHFLQPDLEVGSGLPSLVEINDLLGGFRTDEL